MRNILNSALSLALLLMPILMQANIIQIEAGTDNLTTAVNSAAANDIIELTTSGGLYHETTYFTVNVPLTIRATEGLAQKPILSCDYGSRAIRVYNDLLLSGVIIDGALGASETARALDPYGSNATQGYKVFVEGCDFLNLSLSAFYAREATQADTISFNNCLFDNIGEVCLNFLPNSIAPASVLHLMVTNSTFSRITGPAIQVNGSGDGNAEVFVNHTTLFDIGGNAIYPINIDQVLITNTIAANPMNLNNDAFYLNSAAVLSNSLYYNFSDAHLGSSYGDTTNIINANPDFVAAQDGDFSLYEVSPAINASTDGTNLGDPRWGVVSGGDDILALLKGPVSMSPTQNSFSVIWETPLDGPLASIVEYSNDDSYGNQVIGEEAWLIPGEGYIHEVVVSGLQPYTEYFYRVSDGTGYSEGKLTKTAPLPGTDFRLMIGGDSRDNAELWEEITTTISEQENIDLAVYVGDYVSNGNERNEWNSEFFDPAQNLHNTRPFIGCIGNHETAFGPSTWYDYVMLPHHPENGQTPESYFNMVYGDINFLVLNTNSNPSGQNSNDEFYTGSPQHNWLVNVLENNTSPWVFVIEHTPILSTSLHGQWTDAEKTHLMPVFEDFVSNGGHLIVFNGDDHNFEHLYKDGVHHFRPAGGGASLYDTGYNMADMPWSVFFEMTHNYSTVDVSENGSIVTIEAHYPDGDVFYSTTLTTSDTPPPNIYLIEPNGVNDVAEDSFLITWSDSDPDNNALINLYYNAVPSVEGGTLIIADISEDDPENEFLWDISGVIPGDYYIYATINDGMNPVFSRLSSGVVSIIADVTAPPPISNLHASMQTESSIHLSWINPTYNLDIENVVADFESDFDGFVGEGDHTADTGSLELIAGVTGEAMRINYSVGVAWGQYGAFKYFNATQDWRDTPTINFWYRGDGSSLSLRLIVSQDNDGNGNKDDQWYSELYNLTSTSWQEANFDLNSLGDLGWDQDIDETFDLQNIFSLEFIVPSGNIASGHLDIDEVKLIGVLPAAPDYAGTKLIRNTDHAPTSHTDGIEIYNGVSETFIDTGLTMGGLYYYAGFAYDEIPNYSTIGPTSVLMQVLDINPEMGSQLPGNYSLEPAFPNPFNPITTLRYGLPESTNVSLTIYDIKGNVVKTLVNEYQNAAWYEIQWNGLTQDSSRADSGIYFVRIQAGSFSNAIKLILLK